MLFAGLLATAPVLGEPPAHHAAVLGNHTVVTVLSPAPDQRLSPGDPLRVRILVSGLRGHITVGSVKLTLYDPRKQQVVKTLTADLDAPSTYRLYDGEQEQFTADVDTAAAGEGAYEV